MPAIMNRNPQAKPSRIFYGIICHYKKKSKKSEETVTCCMNRSARKNLFCARRPTCLWLAAAIALLLLHSTVQSTPPTTVTTNAPVLGDKYKQWLEVVAYIITPDERKIFHKLTNDRDRDAFMSIFWNQRDPTKGTPENEFKNEHLKRIEYANRYFGYSSPLPGWKTDRGRIHILLGPPVNRSEIIKGNLYPIEIWEYYGDTAKGMPTMFHVVFYKRGGAGDFRLYIPAQDGPDQLLIKEIGQFSSGDYESIYNEILQRSSEVAEVALSLIPGERTINFAPSMRDMTLLAQIADLPLKNLNTTYASQFLKFKAYVNVEDSVDYPQQPPRGRSPARSRTGDEFYPFRHLAGTHLGGLFRRERESYYCDYKIVVDLKQNGRSIFQYTKNLPFTYKKDELNAKLASGLILADCFPVIDGRFELIVFVQNAVNREFSFFEKKIDNTPAQPGQGTLYGPIVSYRINREARGGHSAFSLLDIHVTPDPQHTFGQQEALQALFSLERGRMTGELKAEAEVSSLPGAITPFSRTFTVAPIGESSQQIYIADLGLLPPGHYQLITRIRDSAGVSRLTGETQFTVSTLPRLPHPPFAAPTLALDKSYIYDGMLAGQYENCARPAEAERAYQKALAQSPGNVTVTKNYAHFLLEQKKYDQLLEAVAPLQNQPQAVFDYHALRGKANYYLGRYSDAIDDLIKANQNYDSDTSVLNTLGLSLLRVNNPGEARRALEASIKVNPQQPDITKLLQQLEAMK